MASTNRKAIHGYVTDPAHDQWHQAAHGRGVSVSAILEVLDGPGVLDQLPDEHPAMVTAARRVDTQRRYRRTPVTRGDA